MILLSAPSFVACAEEAERQLNESGGGLPGKGGKHRRQDSPVAEGGASQHNLSSEDTDGNSTLFLDEDDSMEDGYK